MWVFETSPSFGQTLEMAVGMLAFNAVYKLYSWSTRVVESFIQEMQLEQT